MMKLTFTTHDWDFRENICPNALGDSQKSIFTCSDTDRMSDVSERGEVRAGKLCHSPMLLFVTLAYKALAPRISWISGGSRCELVLNR